MVLSCPTVIVALFIAELNSTLYQDLPTDVSAIPLENHELVVSGTYPQGSTINSGFNNVHLLHIQGNPYFALNKQSRTLQNKIAIDTIQGDTSFTGVFMMAVNKQNQSQANFLYCVTYCVGNDTEQLMHEACYDSVSSGALHTTVNGVLLSQHVYESNISRHASVAGNVLQLSLTPGNKSNVTFTLLECSSGLFFVDDRGVLRIGRQLVEEDIAIHVLKIAISANISDALQLELALVTVKVIEANTLPPIFEEPDGYNFVVKEGEPGLRVGFVKAVDSDAGSSGKVVYSFGKQQSTSLFELNDASGEIKTAVALDRETAESHLFIVVATDEGVPKPFSSQVEVRVVVEDINDNRPVFMDKEAELILSAYTQPGPILSLKAEDKDTGKNALMTYAISQGNDRKMFGINSTSGELLLVAPLTVTANDKIVLVVSVVDVLSTNSSFQDTAVVKITFRDVTYSGAGAKSRSVALISGVSVGGVLFITIIAAVSLLLWKKQKSQLNKRKKYGAIPVIKTDPIPFEYERKIYTVGDAVRRSSFEIYPPLNDTARSPGTPRDSQISLDLNTIEYALHQFSLVSNRPGLSHSAPSSPTRELRRSRGSHVSLDLTEMRSQSLSVLPSYITLDMSQVQPGFISKFAERCFKLGGIESGSHLTSKGSSEYSHTSCGSYGEEMSFESWGSLSTNRHQSFHSKPSIELEPHEDVSEEHFSTDEHLGRRNLRYAKPPHVQQISSSQLYEETPHETVSLPIVIGDEENVTPEDDQQLPIENLNRSISLPDMAYSSTEGVDQAVRAEISTEAEVESPCLPTLDSTATQSYSKLQPVKSRKARIPVKAKKALQLMTPEKESKQYFQQESSSNDSDDTTQEPNTSIPRKKFPLFDRKKKKSSSRRLQSVSSERRSEVNEPLKAESFISSSSQDSVTSMATQMFIEEASFSPTLLAITDVARTMENTNVVGKQVFHVSQEQDIPYSTDKAGPKDGSGSSSHKDEPSGTVILSPGNALITDSYRAMGESGTSMMLSEGVSEPRGNLETSDSGRSRVSLGSTHSSEDSRTSSGGSKDIDLPREDASFTSIGSSRSLQTDRPQGSQSKLSIELEADQPSSEDYFSTDERPSRRKALKSITPDTLRLCAKLQPPGSFEDNSSSLHQRRSTDDSGKSQSSYTKLQPVKPKKSRIPLKVKKAFKFLTSETEHKEGSSEDSEDTMQEPITPTSRKRFSLFGGKRKKSASRGKTPRHDSLLQKESDVLPVPSTQQENAPVVTDQSVITDHFPCSTELETREMRGADTLTEGSIGVASDNGEKLENASAGLSKSSESAMRDEDATIESKEIEEFEREDNVDLSTECDGHSALLMDDSMDAITKKTCKIEDIEGSEGDLQEQTLRSESVSRESVGEVVEQIEAGSFILSPGQVNLKSSATPSLSQVASFSTRCSKARITSTSHVPSESSMTDLSLHSSQTGKQEHLLKDVKPELTPQAKPFSSTPDNSITSSGSPSVVVVSFCSGEDEKPLRQSKPCVVLSDSYIQLSGESTSSTRASRSSILSLQARENRGSVERAAQSQSSVTDLSALHLPLDTSGAERLQHLSPAWSRRNSMEPLSLDVTRDNAVDASSSGLLSPELSSPRSRQETSRSGIAMLMPSVNNLLFSRERPHDDDTGSETDN